MKFTPITLLLAAMAVMSLSSCNDQAKLRAEIKKTVAHVDTSMVKGTPDIAAMKKVDSIMEVYINKYPKDTMSPKYMLREAMFNESMKNYPKCHSLLDKVQTDYPDNPRASEALFLDAFIYDSDESNFPKAKEKYELYLQKYPNGKRATQVQQLINILGVPPEDIIKGFEKNKPDTAKIPS